MSTQAHYQHICQVYSNEEKFLGALEAYVGTGLRLREAVIVIATPAHHEALQARLRLDGHDVSQALAQGHLIALDAEELLAQIVVDGWPDKVRFERAMAPVMNRARHGAPGRRAFTEMVALLWSRGRFAATLRLEEIWNEFLAVHHFPLFCAYPRAHLEKGRRESIEDIRAAHSEVVAA